MGGILLETKVETNVVDLKRFTFREMLRVTGARGLSEARRVRRQLDSLIEEGAVVKNGEVYDLPRGEGAWEARLKLIERVEEAYK